MSVTKEDIIHAKTEAIALFDGLLANFPDRESALTPDPPIDYTYDMAYEAIRDLIDAKLRDEAESLLAECNAKTMSSLDASKYEHFTKRAREILNDQ